MLARIERGQGQLVPTFLLAQVAYLPDEVVCGFCWKPRLQYVADTEAAVLTSEEAPRALQLAPEQHEAFLGVLDCNHIILILTK